MTPTERPFPLELKPITRSGANKVAEPTDPYVATAMSIRTPGYDGVGEMARTFVEEFGKMGWSRDRIARLFRVPRYEGAYAVYRARGAEFVDQLIDDVLGPEPAPAHERRGDHG